MSVPSNVLKIFLVESNLTTESLDSANDVDLFVLGDSAEFSPWRFHRRAGLPLVAKLIIGKETKTE